MLIKDSSNCNEFVAGDKTILYELLHPTNDSIDIHYSLAHAIVKPGEMSLPHKLKSSEVYYITEGSGVMYINDESDSVYTGQAIYVPPNTTQYIKNTDNKDLKFLCIVDPAWKIEDEEVFM